MRTLAIPLLLAAATFAQNTPRFEVTSVKPSRVDPGSTSGIYSGQGRIDAHNVTLRRAIIGAYRVGPNEIVGGPDWLNEDRLDILAKAEQSTDGDAALMDMLQSLLADRFKLKLHREMRTMTAYVLEITKNGAKFEKAEEGAEGSTNTNSSNDSVSIKARSITMDRLANALAREVDLPVINRTGLDGAFNFELHFARERSQPSDRPDDVSLFTAIQEQLGLRLRSEKVPVDVLVIDSAEKPSEN